MSGLPPLVLVNGYAATSADWDPTFIQALSEHSDLVLPDNPGMGEAPALEGEPTIGAMAEALLAGLDDRGIERTALAGWSMGGMVAQEAARLAPGRFEALVLLATDLGGPEAVPAEPGAWARLTDHSGTPREQATRLIGLLFPPAVAEGIDRDFGQIVADAREGMDLAVLLDQEAAMAAWHESPRGELPFAMPVLAAAGEEDEVIPAANALQAADAAGAWLARFPGTGHGFMAQEPRRLAALIGAFLGR